MAIGAVYAAMARLALVMAIPEGYATPLGFWPAAGIALTGTLILGSRIWPGIFLGAMLADATMSFEISSAPALLDTLLLPGAIAAGVTLQAVVGARLVRRLVGFPSEFSKLGRILVTMALGGPVACLISSTVGVTSLLAAGVIGLSEVPSSWVTWWSGDTVGVLVVLPLTLAWGREVQITSRRTRQLVALPVVAAAIVVAASFLSARAAEIAIGRAEFERRAVSIAETLRHSLETVPPEGGVRARVERVMTAFRGEGIRLEIVDASGGGDPRWIYGDSVEESPIDRPSDRLEWSTDLSFDGRTWRADFVSTFERLGVAERSQVWFILTGGLLFVSLLGAFLLEVAGRTAMIESANEELRREMEERMRVEEALRKREAERDRAERERTRLEARVRRAQKLESLGILAGGIAHDFNNILHGILGSADLALGKLEPDDPTREHLADIEKAADRAAELSNQLLAYSGKGKFVVESIELSALIEGLQQPIAASLPENVSVRYDLGVQLPRLEADPNQIRQVVLNLVSNAAEAVGDAAGFVTISTGHVECHENYLAGVFGSESLRPGPYVYLEVRDSGCGMDRATRERIFEPFFSTKFTGRGLGLAAALGIVRGHRGAIDVRSKLGGGARIRVLFPATHPPARARPTEASSEVRTRAGTVLLVEDEPMIRRVATRMLESMGLEVSTAEDGVEAVELYRERADDIDLVLLDLAMPRLGGDQAFAEIRRIRPDAKVILSSGYPRENGGRLGGRPTGFLRKPYRLDDLRDLVASILAGEPAGGGENGTIPAGWPHKPPGIPDGSPPS